MEDGAEGQQIARENKIIPFPVDRIKPLPSEKADPFIPHERPADLQTLDFLLWLPKGRSGFRFETDQALTKEQNELTPDIKAAMKARTVGQMKFEHGDLAKEALDAYRANPTEENKKTYEAARLEYLSKATPKVGMRNLRLIGDTLKIDTKPISFQANAAMAAIKSTDAQLEDGVGSATSGNVIFARDRFGGERRLGLMKRNKRNNRWRNVPGALIAGYFDGNMDKKASKLSPKQGRRTLTTINNQAIYANGYKELHEEIGVEEKDVRKSKVVGLAVEKADRVHHEVLMDVELKLTAAQAKEKSKLHHVDDKEEFTEDWIDIDCTPEAIYTLLTKVLSPLPTGHLAAFAATGRALVAEKSGEKAADEYMKKLSLGIIEHNERINGIVRDYVRNNPDVLTHPTEDQLNTIEKQTVEYKAKNPTASEDDVFKYAQGLIDNRAKFNPDGFNPALLPEEQGLPDLDTALAQAGLVGQAQELAKAA